MSRISDTDKKWVNEVWEKIETKMEICAKRNSEKIPYFAKNGVFDDRSDNICWWTNGFWAGIMWHMFEKTKKEIYLEVAKKVEQKLDGAFEEYYGLHHDVGFMWLLSAGVDYKLTGNDKSKKRCLRAADMLAGRINTKGGFIQAWNGEEHKGKSIIDSMMNLPLLYWASDETGDSRYKHIAKMHADSVIKNHIRSDYSVNHIVRYDADTGEMIEILAGQGYAKGSAWSRGQAWALYGFILSYIHTKDERYLDIAKKCSDYFIECVSDDWLPKVDFKAPEEPVIYDSTAGACAVCGLLELAEVLGDEGKVYFEAALNILKAMEREFCNWDCDYDSILQFGSEAYSGCRHIPIIYGDYFFIEAICKLSGMNTLYW